jgi:hypothetical protein
MPRSYGAGMTFLVLGTSSSIFGVIAASPSFIL